MRKRRTGGTDLQGTRHVLDQLEKRCGLPLYQHELATLEQTSERLYGTPNGIARLVVKDRKPAVLMIKDRKAITAITLDMAFANCPKAVFYALVARGELHVAVALRIRYVKGSLPPAAALHDSQYNYSRRATNVLWKAFSWVDLQHS